MNLETDSYICEPLIYDKVITKMEKDSLNSKQLGIFDVYMGKSEIGYQLQKKSLSNEL